MSSVTQLIGEIKQPRGGYIKPSQFDVRQLDDGKMLANSENVHASIVGMAVDYLTRFRMGADVKDAFFISLHGAELAFMMGRFDAVDTASELLSGICGLDDKSIACACKLVTFDVWYRNSGAAMMARGANDTNPDSESIQNIRTMVERSVAFLDEYGPIVQDGFGFGPNGYTKTVNSGDGDFLTKDTLWDFKVSKAKPTNKHTLQLLMYWIMGQHSGNAMFDNIKRLGVFNPRLNVVYTLNVDKISNEIIRTVETDVIGY